MKNYLGFIFDLDGTLLDSKQDIVDATNATIVHMGGKALDAQLIASFVGRGVRDLIQKALKNIPGADEKKSLEFFTDYYLKNGDKHSRFFPGADEFLEFLQQRRLPCAILTNKPQIYTDAILLSLNKLKYFDQILGTDSGFPRKPDPQGFLAILKNWQLKPQDVLYFGDSDVDVETARNAGADYALFLEGFTPEAELRPFLAQAKLVFRDYRGLDNHFEASLR